jgi:hypothetical protein
MARITVEQTALTDLRYQTLGRLFRKDRRWALGVMVSVWNQCQELETYHLSHDDLLDIHPDLKRLGVALVEAGLARPEEDGKLYICGTRNRIEWLKERRETGRSANIGRTNKGGRPRKPLEGLMDKPPGGLPDKPPPAPAPAPALKTIASTSVEVAKRELRDQHEKGGESMQKESENSETEHEPLNPVLREARDAVKQLRKEGAFKTLPGEKQQAPSEDLNSFLLDRFPEISEPQRTGFIRRGMTIQAAYRVDSMWTKIRKSNPPGNAGAYLYRMLESALPAPQEAASAH